MTKPTPTSEPVRGQSHARLAEQVYDTQSAILGRVWTKTAIRPTVMHNQCHPTHAPEITSVTLTWAEFVSLVSPLVGP